MAGETIITVVGNLTADPELRFTPSGAAASHFVIASTPRNFDRQANEWKDGETLFVRCTVWREAAENAAESLTKGMRVIAQGRLQASSFETKKGERRTAWELQVDETGPSLRFATANVQRQGKQGGGGDAQASAGALGPTLRGVNSRVAGEASKKLQAAGAVHPPVEARGTPHSSRWKRRSRWAPMSTTSQLKALMWITSSRSCWHDQEEVVQEARVRH